jgi:DNA-binding FrmR family transcriptional regulator
MLLEERSEIIRRLRISEGHLHAIIGMVETDQPFEQVLHQLGAVRAALRAASAWLLTFQVEQSGEIISHSSCTEERASEMLKLRELFTVLTQSANLHEEDHYE